MIDGLIQNATLLLSLATLYSLFLVRLKSQRLSTQWLKGALFGLAAVVAMLYPLELQPGLIFDGRSVILGLAGVFSGPLVAAVAAAVAGSYRLWLGGAGVYMGVATIVTAAVLGASLHALIRRRHWALNARNLLLFGFVLHLLELSWVILLPSALRMSVLSQVALPFLVVLPLLTLVLGLLLHTIAERETIRNTLAKDRAFLRTLVQTLPDLIWVKDPDGVYLACNPRFEQFFGASEAAIKGRRDLDFMPAAEAELFRRHDLRALAADGPVMNEETITFACDGHRERLETIKTQMRDAEGRLIGVLGIARDVTSLRDREYFFFESQRAARIGSYKTDFIADRWESSGVLDDIFGIDAHYERNVSGWLKIVYPDDRESMQRYLQEVVLGAGQPFNREYRICRQNDGETRWVLGLGQVSVDASGQVVSMTGTIQDVTERKEVEQQNQALAERLEHIAYHDHLTGVPNRRLLTDRLEQALKQTRRDHKLLAVCYLDLDGFKPINDRYGHSIGDLFLVQIAERLRGLLRASDTIARFGGDEFVLLLTQLTRPRDCDELLERLLSAICQPIEVQNAQVSVSASLGVTLYPLDRSDPDTLLRHADQAMYRAKESGKNCYHLYDPEQDRQLHARRDKLSELAAGLERGDLCLHYQPQVDLISRKVIGFEALIRWQHPRDGLLMPGAFLDDLEGTELEIRVGEWVIETALCQLAAWQAIDLLLPISVNISAGHLLRADFAARLQKTLNAYPQVVAGQLKLEILETAAISDFEQAKRVLTDCRALGVHFALDDFGTGYSSLAYFRTLPVDMLKIDQSFVRDMLADAGDMEIVDSVVKLSHAFNRNVIAEGVETMAHAALLTWIGCHFGQGYGIARPMPVTAVPNWLDTWREQTGWSLDAIAKDVDDSTQNSPLRQGLPLMLLGQNCRYWIERLNRVLTGTEGLSTKTRARLTQQFAPWTSVQHKQCAQLLKPFPRVDEQHQRLHALVIQTLARLEQENRGSANRTDRELTELQQATEQLLDAIGDSIRELKHQDPLESRIPS